MNPLNFRPIDNWQKFYRMYSFWFFVFLGAAPDLYTLATSMGVLEGQDVPAFLTRIINTLAFLGAASRLIQQKSVQVKAEQAAEENQGNGS